MAIDLHPAAWGELVDDVADRYLAYLDRGAAPEAASALAVADAVTDLAPDRESLYAALCTETIWPLETDMADVDRRPLPLKPDDRPPAPAPTPDWQAIGIVLAGQLREAQAGARELRDLYTRSTSPAETYRKAHPRVVEHYEDVARTLDTFEELMRALRLSPDLGVR